MPVNVAIVEDNATLRMRLLERFQFFDSVSVVFAAATGEGCLSKLQRCKADERPQVILMDIELPGIDGIQTTRRVKDKYPGIDILMLTIFEHEERIFSSIQAGASGYLLKDTSTKKIVSYILELVAGGAPMSPAIARKMLGYLRSQNASKKPLFAPTKAKEAPFDLSSRELEILRHLIKDEAESVIAGKLNISPHTVRTHIKNVYKKMHVHSRASAVRVALENQVISDE